MVVGGNQPAGFTNTVYSNPSGGSFQPVNLLEVDIVDLKKQLLSVIARNPGENTVAPRSGIQDLYDYLDTDYGPVEAGVKRVMVVLNNSVGGFDEVSSLFPGGNPISLTDFEARLAQKGVSLLVNTPPGLGALAPGLLQEAAIQNYTFRNPQNLLLDRAAEQVCTEQDP